jgi:N-acetylmuramoyl-L-alanine amidase
MRIPVRLVVFGLLLAFLSPLPAGAQPLPLIKYQGRPYVALDGVASALKAKADWTRDSVRARLTLGRQAVVLTRNWTRVLVNGKPLVLSAPAVVAAGKWLVPEEFLGKVIPKIAPRARLTARRAAAAAPARTASTATPSDSAPQSAAGAREATLTDLRVRSYPSFTRVVVEADAPFGHQMERRVSDVRVRLGGLTLAAPRVDEVSDGHIGQVRLETQRGDAMIIVTFEAGGGDVRATTFTDPFRLVLDFPRAAAERPARPGEEVLRHMVLDAGHGGHDSGAVGPTGLMEKDLVLDVTRRVTRLTEDRLGIRVTLSRSGDYFVPLNERTSFANRERADLFVSIHANAHRDLTSEGVETYFLSSEATDIAARQVAAKENSVIELESPAARRKMDMVRTILWDLAQSEYLQESSNLAEIVQDSMTEALRIPNRGVKQAAFYVLGGAAMPAVLVEIGFVTNPKEERRLKDTRYRDEIARAIFAGIAGYKKQYDQRMRASIGVVKTAR